MLIHIIKVLICGSVVICLFGWAVIHAIRVHDEQDTERLNNLIRKLQEGERW